VHRRIVPLGVPARAYLVTLQDRSQEARAAAERETLLAELRATLESTADGILVLDTAGRIRAFNRRFAQLWDLPEVALAEPADATVLDWMRRSVLQPEAYQQRVDEINAQLLVSGTDTVALLNGRLLERYTQPQWSRGRPIGRVYSFRELARSRATAPVSAGASGLDGSTGWPNRHRFLEELDEAVLQARDDGQPLAVLVVEFDRHALFAADGSARARGMDELVEALRATVREPAQLGRLGVALRGAAAPGRGIGRRGPGPPPGAAGHPPGAGPAGHRRAQGACGRGGLSAGRLVRRRADAACREGLAARPRRRRGRLGAAPRQPGSGA
jgi:GGDEF domain-containing protein